MKNPKALISALILFVAVPLFSQTPNIDTTNYVTVRDGHLYLKGERVRYWGAIGSFPAPNYAANIATVKRLKSLGFNMVRYWTAPLKYTKGDNSRGDLSDHFLYCCAQEGIQVWFATLNSMGEISLSDASVINDPSTEANWKKAVFPPQPTKAALNSIAVDTNAILVRLINRRKERGDSTSPSHQDIEAAIARYIARMQSTPAPIGFNSEVRYWDERIHKLAIQRHRTMLNHVNQYTGYRYADDPVFAIWELTNEEWWFFNIKNGTFMNRLPRFFRENLISLWNDFLVRKYETNTHLCQSWNNNLLSGESLTQKNIALLPFSETSQDLQSVSLGVGITIDTTHKKYSPRDFTTRRSGDVIEFLLSLWTRYKKEEADSAKACGAGIMRAPMVWDNGIGYDMPTQFMQSQADAVSHDSYFNGPFSMDSHHKRFPWLSQLEELPKVCWQDPWLEHNKVSGKPFFVYETQIMQPAKYRAEYPLSLAKIGAIQDWDAICWHYWGHPRDTLDTLPFAQPLDYSNQNHFTQGYHYQFDEVLQSSMSMAALIFKQGLLKPAPKPTLFIFGRNSLYDWNMTEYGKTGEMFLPTVYRYGMRLLIDTSRAEDAIIGPRIINRGVYESCPIVPTDEISHDWQKGTLVFDAPGVKSFVGFLANYGKQVLFKGNFVLSNVTINNPQHMPYPVTQAEKYISFSIATADEKPLETTKKAYISLVSTSFNSNFSIDTASWLKTPFNPSREWNMDPNSFNPGSLPVLVARVGATITSPSLASMRYRYLDWHFKEIGKGVITNNTLTIPSKKPIFLIELTR